MTNKQLAIAIATEANKAAYAAATDKSWFVQELVEAMNIVTHPGSALCDYVEDFLNA